VPIEQKRRIKRNAEKLNSVAKRDNRPANIYVMWQFYSILGRCLVPNTFAPVLLGFSSNELSMNQSKTSWTLSTCTCATEREVVIYRRIAYRSWLAMTSVRAKRPRIEQNQFKDGSLRDARRAVGLTELAAPTNDNGLRQTDNKRNQSVQRGSISRKASRSRLGHEGVILIPQHRTQQNTTPRRLCI